MQVFTDTTLGRVILENPLGWFHVVAVLMVLGTGWLCVSSPRQCPRFDWTTKEPLKLRPFKPKYHLTMSIENSSASELIEMDRNYLDRMNLRKSIMRDHSETVLAADRTCKPAIDELYSWLLGNYLSIRFPGMFELAGSNTERYLHSLVTGDRFSTTPPNDPFDALKVLGALIDDDILFLMRSTDGDGYVLKAFVTCFPSGFDTREKFNWKLRDIHKPVPGYKEKLEKSMDKYFDRVETGKFIKRANWTITTTDQLFVPGGTHLYEGETPKEEVIDIEKTRVRCERQVLHRLPKTGAIVFSFKTYLYPLSDIKAEGLGGVLAEAIDGLRGGSVPEFHWYKRAAVWGETVKEYLRN
ncbi:hypothetical protein K490DRAFT_74412 [Saccharata proteae CBS 121410]|uniref:Uncharacterized protein n=1 Tax=Saccharata proteae CBS 121410 TaxID=1314787 RepID=A0A9P4HTX0_9PEZI|nr:hypothetical protein K490DRAFT_74412 [Saccharata proteae CBS 121410]